MYIYIAIINTNNIFLKIVQGSWHKNMEKLQSGGIRRENNKNIIFDIGPS